MLLYVVAGLKIKQKKKISREGEAHIGVQTYWTKKSDNNYIADAVKCDILVAF